MRSVTLQATCKKMLGAALATLLLASCGHRMTVMTYNVGVFSKYMENSIPEVAALIGALDAELVSLNELDSVNRRHATFQLADLAGTLGGWDFAFASAFPFAEGAYGNGIVSRIPILRRDRIDLPRLDGYEPRSVAVVETANCVFASTHLDVGSAEASAAQARIINEWFTAHYAGSRKPVLLCGDMNARPDSRTLAVLDEAWERLTRPEPSYPSNPAEICIDYILSLKSARKVQVEETRVVRTYEGIDLARTSDHLPVLVTFRY